MKVISRIVNIIFYLTVIFLIISAAGSAVTQKPLFLTAVRSNSMYPLFQKGDMLFIKRISSNESIKIGDIVIFKSESGSLASKGWISHRIVGGNDIDGYITKGDANLRSDQDESESPPIKREWISSKVITLGSIPLKLPFIGHIPLWAERLQKNPYILPIVTVVLAVIIGVSELSSINKKRKKNKLELPLTYFFSGITLSIILLASMLAKSQHLSLTYEVTEAARGVIQSSNVGILKLGDSIELPLSNLDNKGFFPIIATITTDDKQIDFSHDKLTLLPGQLVETTIKVKASTLGKFEPVIHVGMFFPFLPSSIIYALAKTSYWLALAVVSLVPGLPLMLYPLIDSRMRAKTIKEIRRKFRRISSALPINF